MSTQYDILRYLQENGGTTKSVLRKNFGVATSKKLKLLKNARMIEDNSSGVVRLSLDVTEEQILSKKPRVIE